MDSIPVYCSWVRTRSGVYRFGTSGSDSRGSGSAIRLRLGLGGVVVRTIFNVMVRVRQVYVPDEEEHTKC